MPLTLADFAESIDCQLRKIATVGHDRQDWYHCRVCGGRKLVSRNEKKPGCLVSQSLLDGQASPDRP
jgi:hypothetical protein